METCLKRKSIARGLKDSYSLSNKQIKNISSHQSPCSCKFIDNMKCRLDKKHESHNLICNVDNLKTTTLPYHHETTTTTCTFVKVRVSTCDESVLPCTWSMSGNMCRHF